LFKGLTAERLAEYKGPMYGLFETEFGTQMIHATEKLKASLADESAATTLRVAVGTPVLSIERVAFTYGERPVELRRAIYLTAQHHYHNELS
jgi:GntR family transcriptional regulator